MAEASSLLFPFLSRSFPAFLWRCRRTWRASAPRPRWRLTPGPDRRGGGGGGGGGRGGGLGAADGVAPPGLASPASCAATAAARSASAIAAAAAAAMAGLLLRLAIIEMPRDHPLLRSDLMLAVNPRPIWFPSAAPLPRGITSLWSHCTGGEVLAHVSEGQAEVVHELHVEHEGDVGAHQHVVSLTNSLQLCCVSFFCSFALFLFLLLFFGDFNCGEKSSEKRTPPKRRREKRALLRRHQPFLPVRPRPPFLSPSLGTKKISWVSLYALPPPPWPHQPSHPHHQSSSSSISQTAAIHLKIAPPSPYYLFHG